LYRFLAIEGVLPEDPTAALDVPKVPKGLPRALAESQIEALLASPVGVSPLAKRDRAILEVLYGGGLRISELVGMSLGDIDIDASLMRVLGKGSRERIVPIGRLALAALIDWLGSSGRAVLSPETWASREAETAVFLNARGGRLSRQGAWLVVRSHGDNVGLGPELTPHVLRHSCATHMLNHGADIRTVQELLGHISITSTQRYTLVSQQVLRDVYDSAHPRAQL
jgi:integrase/recombinase XerD